MVIFIRYIMKQRCKQCQLDFDVDDYISSEIRSIMEEEQVCFTCAFWKWQKKLDESRPNEGILPIITQEYYKKVSCTNKQTHYCLTLGINNLLAKKTTVQELFNNIYTGILTTDGYLFPYTGYSEHGGISHQGDIPVNNKDFTTNAIFIHGSELKEILALKGLSTCPYGNIMPERFYYYYYGFFVKVPEEVVKSKFNMD